MKTLFLILTGMILLGNLAIAQHPHHHTPADTVPAKKISPKKNKQLPAKDTMKIKAPTMEKKDHGDHATHDMGSRHSH